MENHKKGKKSALYYIVLAICLLLSSVLGITQLDSDNNSENNTTIAIQEQNDNLNTQEEQLDSQEEANSSYEDNEGNIQTITQEDIEDTNSNIQQSNQVLEENSSEWDNQEENSQPVKEEIQEQEEKQDVAQIEETVTIKHTFRNEGTFQSHYEKHGIEMGFDTKEEYLLAANKVILNPESLHKLEKEDGDDVYYLEESNEFVVVSKDGYIRTYFYPSAGIDYYNRQ